MNDMKWNVISLTNLYNDREKFLEQLQKWRLVPREGEYFCPKCSGELKLCIVNDRIDGYRWRCNRTIRTPKKKAKICPTIVEFRTHTFFARSRLSLLQILAFINLWVDNSPLSVLMRQASISKPTCVDWSSFCREVIFEAYMRHPRKLGGREKIVEIYESKFGEGKYHHGHKVEGRWVFGGYETESGKVFMVSVEDRGQLTLLPIIKDWILPGTTVASDFWKAYDTLNEEDYQQIKVDHKLNFRDSDSVVKGMEATRQAIKSTRTAPPRKKMQEPENLARYIFEKKCGEFNLDRMIEFLKLIPLLYNPLEKNSIGIPEEEIHNEDLLD